MCSLWENNKGDNNKLSLFDQINYMNKLGNQMDKAHTRLVYTTSGIPTATIIRDPDILIDTKLYWIKCQTLNEAYYLAAIINSQHLKQSVESLMVKGAYGARDLHKHLWRFPIPEYDNDDSLHTELARLGKGIHSQVQNRWAEEKEERTTSDKTISVTVARRVLRDWLTTNPEAQKVEFLVEQLMKVASEQPDSIAGTD